MKESHSNELDNSEVRAIIIDKIKHNDPESIQALIAKINDGNFQYITTLIDNGLNVNIFLDGKIDLSLAEPKG